MKLKSLEISGFKSFADFTKIEFLPGMTGIVGPNGSGKSNISEAIRWVLGEQSAKSLRGNKMPEVIFAGSADRKPLNRAQVRITFDNSDHYLNSDFSELTVTRKLFRTGESEYLINEQSCRLKDVLELFMDSGLGGDSFSIISQGRVESIFNSKPEDRRVIIEEVAGVFKYKKHKQKAERELQDTDEYLDRINDILNELNSQIKPLEEQSSLATDYLDQQKRYEKYDQERLAFEINQSESKKTTLTEQQNQAKQTLKQISVQVAESKNSISELSRKESKLLKTKDQLQDDLVNATSEYESLVGKKEISKERSSHLLESKTKLKDQIQEQTIKLTGLKQEIAVTEKNLLTQKQRLNDMKSDLQNSDKASFEKQIQNLEKQIENKRNEYVDLMQQRAGLHNDQQYLTKNQQTADQRLKRIDENLTTSTKLMRDLQGELKGLEDKVQQVSQKLTELQTKRDSLGTSISTSNQKGNDLQNKWLAALEIYQKAQAKLNSLRTVSNEYSGFYQGVRSVLQNRKKFSGLIGPVSEILKVDKQYTTAFEFALGNQVQQIIVEDDGAAQRIISYLSKNHLGRATFLPLTTIKTYQISTGTLTQLKSMSGFIGIASQLISVKPRYQTVIDHLLGTTIICDTLAHATVIAKQIHYKNRIVTLTGDILSANGSITGGQNRKQRAGILEQNQELTDLESSVQQMSTKLTEQENYLKELKAKQDEGQKSLDLLEKDYNETQNSKRDLVSQKALLESRLNEQDRQTKAYAFEKEQQSASLTTKEQLEKNQHALDQIELNLSKNQQEMTEFKTQLAEKRTLSDKVTNDFQAAHEEYAIANEKYQQLQRTGDTERNQLADAIKNSKLLKTELQQLEDGTNQDEVSKIELAIKRAATQKMEIQAYLDDGQRTLNTVKLELIAQNTELEKRQQLTQLSTDEVQKIETKLARLDMVSNQQMDKLAETYHVSYADIRNQVADEPIETVMAQLKLLKRGLDEIGEVNVGAIEEYKRVKERHDFLIKQQDDLLASKQQLLSTMDKMDVEVQKRFKKSFDEVAAQFEKTFVQMFGGGKAKLILTEPDHLLTSGIDIMAQPPGKKFQNMRLLSGGERSLTAITLLFAILNVRPIPFCILDEAEAALDPANVERFADYLSNFNGETQFIVITHRKETMIYADILYGVTMQESGVSKMVSVNLDELVS